MSNRRGDNQRSYVYAPIECAGAFQR